MNITVETRGLEFDVKFDLDSYLLGKDNPEKECYLKFKYRPGGAANPDFIQAVENLSVARQIERARIEAIEDAGERKKAQIESDQKAHRDLRRAIYKSSVIDWSTNIRNKETGQSIEATEENYLELWDLKVIEIGDALLALEAAIDDAGKELLKKDKETEGN